jgi:hypothetical protein
VQWKRESLATFGAWKKLLICWVDLRKATAQFSSLSQLATYAKEETKIARRRNGQVRHRSGMRYDDYSVICVPVSFGQRFSAAGFGFMALSWGLTEAAAAKKWKQKYGEPTSAEQMEIKKSHSISNLPKLLAWLVLSIAALYVLALVFVHFFHYQHVQLIQHDPYLPQWSSPTNK